MPKYMYIVYDHNTFNQQLPFSKLHDLVVWSAHCTPLGDLPEVIIITIMVFKSLLTCLIITPLLQHNCSHDDSACNETSLLRASLLSWQHCSTTCLNGRAPLTLHYPHSPIRVFRVDRLTYSKQTLPPEVKFNHLWPSDSGSRWLTTADMTQPFSPSLTYWDDF